MNKNKLITITIILIATILYNCNVPHDEQKVKIVTVEQSNFSAVDVDYIDFETIKSMFKGEEKYTVSKVDFAKLQNIDKDMPDLLIWAYGSAICDEAWKPIYKYLLKGGNIFVTGGKAFSVEMMKKNGKYKEKGFTNRFIENLNIIDVEVIKQQIQSVNINEDFDFLNKLIKPEIEESYALLGMMSTKRIKDRNGSLSNMDGVWKSILHGTDENKIPSIPLIAQFDRHEERFAGGRWIFMTFKPKKGFYEKAEAKEMLKTLIKQAANKPIAIRINPEYASYKPKDKAKVNIDFNWLKSKDKELTLDVEVKKDSKKVEMFKDLKISTGEKIKTVGLKETLEEGLYHIKVKLKRKDEIIEIRNGGFICYDKEKMKKGEPFSVNSHFLTRGGKSFPVSGMTYMASDVHRYYFIYPNPYIWDKDMKKMKANGVNMIRTGLWTGHDFVLGKDGKINEKSMRAFDAFLASAKKYDLPVQICFFHMQPSFDGIKNPFSSPKAIAWQKKYIQAFVKRYKDNPDIIWDLINEPTYGMEGRVWFGSVPSGQKEEQQLWTEWLNKKYGSAEIIASKWNTVVDSILTPNGYKLPTFEEFEKLKIYPEGKKPLKAFDFNLFSQYAYNKWAATIKKFIREAGGKQMVITGQDEGGVMDRVINQFYAEESPFVTIHNWWQHDDLLWDNITGKPTGSPILIQETGNMRYTNLRDKVRTNEQQIANSLERRMCIGFGAEGAGAIPWVWNTNVYLKNENEAFIGLNRGDGTEKPEVSVFKKFASFLNETKEYYNNPKAREVKIIIPFSYQLSAYSQHAQTATKQAIRAMHYYEKMPCAAASEYHLDREKHRPKLAILPSAMVLKQEAWEKLMEWVKQGTVLLITGGIDRNEHFETVERLSKLGVETTTHSLIQHSTNINIDGKIYPLDYYGRLPMPDLDRMQWEKDGGSVKIINSGKGKILVTEYPVELNTNISSIAALYSYALKMSNVERSFEVDNKNNGILIRPTEFEKARIYLIVSETDTKQTSVITDKITNKKYTINTAPGRAQLFMISKENGEVISSYGIDNIKVE